ncbi:MAG: TM2 domain-containing protein [Zoogloeaceae bacterium]|nr:TM2 domain-containing protein [Zoogloeaceae bacterium]
MFCSRCGQSCPEGSAFCPSCGSPTQTAPAQPQTPPPMQAQTFQQPPYPQPGGYGYAAPPPPPPPPIPGQKSKLAAGLLGIFLGGFGIHNFYLGFPGRGVAQLLLTLVGWILLGLGPLIAWIWGLIEGITILCSNGKTCAKGIPLAD